MTKKVDHMTQEVSPVCLCGFAEWCAICSAISNVAPTMPLSEYGRAVLFTKEELRYQWPWERG